MLSNVVMEMIILQMDMIEISEVWWTRINRIKENRYEFIYSGGEKYERNVGKMIRENIAKMVEDVFPISDRVMTIRINSTPEPMTVVQIHAPTNDKKDEKIGTFDEDLETALKKESFADTMEML